MASNGKKQHFIDLLHELFQLDQPELDFVFYKIMHAKSGQIQDFIDEELSQHIDHAFADQGSHTAEDKLAQARHAVLEAIGEDAFEGDELKGQYKNTNFGKAFLETRDAAEGAHGNVKENEQRSGNKLLPKAQYVF